MSDAVPGWNDLKPVFYEDATEIARNALEVLRSTGVELQERFISYGRSTWDAVEHSLKSALAAAYSASADGAPACPYSDQLKGRMHFRTVNLPGDFPEDRKLLLESTFVGAYEAPVLITGLLRRMPAAARVHQTDVEPAVLAANSIGMIRKPLNHPQQWAQPFIFTLVAPEAIIPVGGGFSFKRGNFLPDDLIAKYTQVDPVGRKLDWSMPIEDFTVNADNFPVYSRLPGDKRGITPENTTFYPRGTRLGDIAFDEDTIGCPGKAVAYFLWRSGVEMATQHNLWAE